jgi:manganese oxidase
MLRSTALPLLWLALAVHPHAPLPYVSSDPGTHPAGRWSHDTLSVAIDARPARWRPDSLASPPIEIQAFAEAGATPSIPGPLIRVREGSVIVVTLRNGVADSTLIVHGLLPHPATHDDTIQVAPGAARVIRFRAGAPGTYLYWGTTCHAATLADRVGPDSQLEGAIVVDPAGTPSARERIFVITGYYVPGDSTKPKPNRGRFQVAINGRAWPYTDRLTVTQGDTVRWRWVNASFESHPMHLHGFFFRVDSRSGPVADTIYAAADRRWVVTERLDPGTTMSMRWVPERAGNWLMHCHIAAHVQPGLVYPFAGDTLRHYPSPSGHPPMDMSGLILGITVTPRGARPPVAPPVARRTIRMTLRELPFLVDSSPAIGVALGSTAPPAQPAGGHDIPLSTLVLTRGEPTRIWVVNQLANEAAIHWHGLEIESYFDGVPGWSGSGTHLMPLIAPGDSFAADMTPPRAGTFIFHSHIENGHHMASGAYGALIVTEPGVPFDSTRDIVLVFGAGEMPAHAAPYLNGTLAPAPRELKAGATYRVRIINIMENNEIRVGITLRAQPVPWTPIAKDAGLLPQRDRTLRPSYVRTSVGETYDFAFTPTEPGDYFLEVSRLSGVVQRQLWRVTEP